jgi:hypothetical protein
MAHLIQGNAVERQERSGMAALKSELYVTVRVRGRSFSIGGVRLAGRRFAIKRGRSWSKKVPGATISQIFDEARRWAVGALWPT